MLESNPDYLAQENQSTKTLKCRLDLRKERKSWRPMD